MKTPPTRDEQNWPSSEIRTPESGAQPFEPDWASPPGDSILDWMKEQDIDREWLAASLGLTPEWLDGILSGEHKLDRETCELLGSSIGPDTAFWLNREHLYRQALRRKDCCEVWPEIARALEWYESRADGNAQVLCTPAMRVNGALWRVDYCPSCGAYVRNREWMR